MILFRSLDNQVTVRQAKISDAANISTIYIKFLKSYGHNAEYDTVFRFLASILAQPWVLFFIATDTSDRIIGFAGCTLTYSAVSQASAITINDMFVEANARRCGVATALCGAIENHARSYGFVKIFLETDPDAKAAIAMYKKAGFHTKPYLAMTKVVPDA